MSVRRCKLSRTVITCSIEHHSNLHVVISGPGHGDEDSVSVRTSISVPSNCGWFYIEITVNNKGRHGYIGDNLRARAKSPIPVSLLYPRQSLGLLCGLTLEYESNSIKSLVGTRHRYYKWPCCRFGLLRMRVRLQGRQAARLGPWVLGLPWRRRQCFRWQ